MLTYFQSILRLPRPVHLYLFSEMLFGLGVGMAVIFNFHYLALGFDTTVIGTATACNTIAIALFSYPAGMMTDRLGSKITMLLGGFLLVLGYLSISQADTPLTLYLSTALLGTGMSFVIACEFPYIMSLCERKEDETVAYNLLIAAFSLTISLGQILGTNLPNILPVGNTMYQTTIYLVVISLLLMWIMRIFLPAKSKRVADEQANQPKQTTWKVIPSRQILIYVLFACFSGIIWNLLGPFENIIMRERFSLSDQNVGYVLAANAFIGFLTSLFVPYLMAKPSRRIFLYSAFAIHLASMLIMGLTVPFYLFALFFYGKGYSALIYTAIIDSSMMKATPDNERGMHSGLRNMTRFILSAGAASFGGYLLTGDDYHTIFFICFLVLSAQVLYYFLFVRGQLTSDLDETF